MGLPRTFVSFSSTDINYYRLMTAWKANEGIDFNFADCQIDYGINSNNEYYIKNVLRQRVKMAGTLVILIGKDTKFKTTYVKWENEIAIEKQCRIIAVNIDGSRSINQLTCPSWLKNVGGIFIPYSPKIIKYALDHFAYQADDDWHYPESVYKNLGL